MTASHTNPLTLAPTANECDHAAHTLAADARYTLTIHEEGITVDRPHRTRARTWVVVPFKHEDQASAREIIPTGEIVRVYFSGVSPKIVDQNLEGLVAAGWTLVGVGWHHECHGRLGWMAFRA